jgi:hypothetical protein
MNYCKSERQCGHFLAMPLTAPMQERQTLSDRQIDTFSDALLALFMVLLLPPNQQKGKHA